MSETYIPDNQPAAFRHVIKAKPSITDGVNSSVVAGMWAVMSAMLANINASQSYIADGLQPLSNKISEISEKMSSYWIDNDLADGMKHWLMQIQIEIGPNSPDKDNLPKQAMMVQVYMTDFNNDNTLLGQSNTFWGGLSTASNQNTSDASQTISVDFQMYTQGPITQLQTIAQVV
jgi:hypothetical protein